MTQGTGAGAGAGGNTSTNDTPSVALTIAGSDSGGGAGIQADLKTFHQFGVFGTSVLVAVTAQNTLGVSGVHAVPAEMVAAQMAALALDLPPRAAKTGMLATAELVSTVAEGVREFSFRPLVVDPVMVSTSGDRLLARDAERTVVDRLIPLAALVTPNLEEACILADCSIHNETDMERAGHAILEMGAGAALIKGHAAGSEMVDLLVTQRGTTRYAHERLSPESAHGTGCTLSAAITAGLSDGADLVAAVSAAIDFVHRAIARVPALGAGHHPLNHFVPAHPHSS